MSPGHASAWTTVRRDMVNSHGTCHGGCLFLLADTAFAFACNTHGPAVERALTGRSGLYDVTVRRGHDVVLEFRGRSRAVPTRTGTPAPD